VISPWPKCYYTAAPEFREREDVAEDWCNRFLAHYFRQYWWTRFARPVLRPVIRVSKWWHGHMEYIGRRIPDMRSRTRWVLGGAAAVLVLAAVVLPYFVDADAQRSVLASRLEAALGRRVKLGKVKLGLFPPALRVEDTEIADALGFTGPAFTTAKHLRARVRLIPLLRGRLDVPMVELEEPTVNLVKNAKGEWNFASIGTTAASPAKPGSPPRTATPLEIGELRIRNGVLNVTDLQRGQPTVRFTEITLDVKNFSRERPFDWEVQFAAPGGGKVSAKGSGGPLNAANLAESTAKGEAHFKGVELAPLAVFTEQAGLGGLFTSDVNFGYDGKTATAGGTYQVDKLRLSKTAGVAQAPVAGKFHVAYDSATERLNVKQFQLGTGNAVAQTTGHMLFAKQPTLDLDTRVTNAPLTDLARLLPALGVRLPAGSSLSGGTLNGQIRARGLAAQPSRRGAVEIANARLANYNIAGKLGPAVRVAGVDTGGNDTVIEQFKSSFVTERGYTSTNDLLLVIPGLNITGSGGFSDAGALNLRGVARLTRAIAPVGGLLQTVTGSSSDIAFRVTGTMENPSVQPDMGRILEQHAESQSSGAGKLLKGLGGLFGRK